MGASGTAASGPSTATRELHVPLPACLTGDRVFEFRGTLLNQAADRRVRRIVVDCGAVEELSPYTMTVLIAASRMLRRHGGELHLARPNALVQQALDGFGLHKVLTVVTDDGPPRP